MSVVFTVAIGTEMKILQRLIEMSGCICFSMRGDIHIEYIYLFKDNRWHVSTGKTTRVKDGYDDGTLLGYFTKFEPVSAEQGIY
jgi:hypothetical protein